MRGQGEWCVGYFCGTLLSLAAKTPKSHKVPCEIKAFPGKIKGVHHGSTPPTLLLSCNLLVHGCYLLTGYCHDRHYSSTIDCSHSFISIVPINWFAFCIHLLLLVINNQPCNRHKPCHHPHRTPPFFSHPLRRKCRLQFHPLLHRHQLKLPRW